ncbi:2'-5' RNA ligase family protein [Actinoalloteichus caeruleus]|uniref:2'-5' RNA ligase family protein n=1 Tax=Actinoalloteichus cyanogriseus TaxID=2893586 RepID=UPI0004AB987D|nr:2'-5' RNA ligase family protein [Actinoalloteichus caeruleus]
MAEALVFYFDDEAERAVRVLWERLERAGVPSLARLGHGQHRPHLTLAMGAAFPVPIRRELAGELDRIHLPDLWLHTVGTFTASEDVLMLGAMVDVELLAVHSAVHDVLAGGVRQPSAYYLPGSWVPHCTLAMGITGEQLVAGFAALRPVPAIHARVSGVGIVDTVTGKVSTLLAR